MSTPEGLLREPNLSSLRSYSTAHDLRGNFTPGTPMSAEAVRNFSVSRGDLLLYPGEAKGELEIYQATGLFSEQLSQTARQLNVSELRLLNSQLKANGYQLLGSTRGPSEIQQLQSMGVPQRNAIQLMLLKATYRLRLL